MNTGPIRMSKLVLVIAVALLGRADAMYMRSGSPGAGAVYMRSGSPGADDLYMRNGNPSPGSMLRFIAGFDPHQSQQSSTLGGHHWPTALGGIFADEETVSLTKQVLNATLTPRDFSLDIVFTLPQDKFPTLTTLRLTVRRDFGPTTVSCGNETRNMRYKSTDYVASFVAGKIYQCTSGQTTTLRVSLENEKAMAMGNFAISAQVEVL